VDTQRYRLGTNNQELPINAPKCPFAMDMHIDGAMHFKTDTRYFFFSFKKNND